MIHWLIKWKMVSDNDHLGCLVLCQVLFFNAMDSKTALNECVEKLQQRGINTSSDSVLPYSTWQVSVPFGNDKIKVFKYQPIRISRSEYCNYILRNRRDSGDKTIPGGWGGVTLTRPLRCEQKPTYKVLPSLWGGPPQIFQTGCYWPAGQMGCGFA